MQGARLPRGLSSAVPGVSHLDTQAGGPGTLGHLFERQGPGLQREPGWRGGRLSLLQPPGTTGRGLSERGGDTCISGVTSLSIHDPGAESEY